MARIRSPNYPGLSLPEALSRVQKIHAAENHLAAPRHVVAEHLGYGGINGASSKVISAIGKYGLLEEVNGDKVKVSPLAMSILFPKSPSEKSDAIREAAFKPALFSEIAQEWEGSQPSDGNLKSFLVRRNFATDAIDRVIQSYRETMELVARESGAYDSPKPGGGPGGQEPKVAVGDYVQWDQGGTLRLPQATKVSWISDDGQWLRVEGSNTGIPMNEVAPAEPPSPRPGVGGIEKMMFDMMGGVGPAPLSERMQVSMNGSRVSVQASLVNASEIGKLIRILKGQQDILQEEEKVDD